jgi:hypothetical protein
LERGEYSIVTGTHHAMDKTQIWSVSNRSKRLVVCHVAPDGCGAFLLTLTLEGEVILSESHFSPAQALERASSLRILLSNWEHTL